MPKIATPEELEYLRAKEQELVFKKNLPHLHGYKMYPWMRKYFNSQDKVSLICSANQIGKSSIQIRKCIHWATSVRLQKQLWPHLVPRQFWYLYPSSYVATIEFEKKWVPEFLPQGELEKHPQYGWAADYRSKYIQALHFNTGISVYFKTYSQDPQDLQAGTCFVAGTLIITKRGVLPIEEVTLNDQVLGNNGWNKVIRLFSREAELIKRFFTCGTSLCGTKEHPVFSNGRFINLERLTQSDVCRTLPLCQTLSKLSLWTAKFIKEIRFHATHGSKTIFALHQEPSFTSQSGKLPTKERFRRAIAYITGITIHSITGSRTCNWSLRKSIRAYTRLKSGKKGDCSNFPAGSVGEFLKVEALKDQFLDIALKDVGNFVIPKILYALNVVNGLLLEKMRPKDSALNIVQTPGSGKVYNLEVSGDHTYYANGILTHNCSAVFTDEELPEELYPELQMRLAATDGYFSSVFTPTLGQEFWRQAIEVRGATERFPDALKLQVSMYDCLLYEDGSASFWSKSRIDKIKAGCKSEAEVQRRVYGRFILDSGLRYQSFSSSYNVIAPIPIPDDWPVYIGVDSGSGGKHNHPAAVAFIAMTPDYKKGYIIKGKRFDGMSTTASDLVEYVRLTRMEFKNPVVGVYYDYSAPDLNEISTRMGEPWLRAEKSHLIGEQVMNVAFKNHMLFIFDTDELHPLVSELKSIKISTPKTQAKDDYSDAVRYGVSKIPWDWSGIGKIEIPKTVKELTESENRKKYFTNDYMPEDDVDIEMAEWDSLMSLD